LRRSIATLPLSERCLTAPPTPAPADEESRTTAPYAAVPATVVGRELARDDAAYFNDRHAVLAAA
jgi:hypothetical protein